MKMKYLMIGLLLFVFAGTAGAQRPHVVPPAKARVFESGNDLLGICQSPLDADKSACSAYVVGVVDLISVLQGWDTWKYKAVCIPEKAINGQVRDVVVKYLVENPAERDRSAAALIMLAVTAAWGCPAS
jgi:hypothetical protein